MGPGDGHATTGLREEQLASAAFDFGAEFVLDRIERALEGEGALLEGLIIDVEVYRTLAEDQPL